MLTSIIYPKMRLSWRSFLLLLLFIAVSTTAFHPFTYQSLHQCAKLAIKTKPGHENIGSSGYVKKTGEVVKVIGLSWNCVFFIGFLHNILEQSDPSTETVPHDPALNMRCKDVKAYLVKDARKRTPIAIIVKEAGNRIKVQSAVSGKLIRHTNQAIYMEVDPFSRKAWVQTQAVDKGYHILQVTHMAYRVYVVTRNHYQIRLYELIVGTSAENKLYAELKSLGNVGFDPLIADPTDDRRILAVALLDASNQVKDADEDEDQGRAVDYPIYPSIPSTDLQKVDGFSVHRRDFENLLMKEGAAMMVPLVSLMGQTYRGVSYAEKHTERASNYIKDRIRIEIHPCLIAIHQAGFYFHQLEPMPMSQRPRRNSDEKFHVPDSKSVAYWIANTRFINEGGMHRRMAYPHTRHEPKRNDSASDTWNSLINIAVIFILMIIVSYIWNAVTQCIRRRIKGKRSKSSHSTAN